MLDDAMVEVEGDVHLAGLERPVLGEGQAQASRHLHLAQPYPVAVSRRCCTRSEAWLRLAELPMVWVCGDSGPYPDRAVASTGRLAHRPE